MLQKKLLPQSQIIPFYGLDYSVKQWGTNYTSNKIDIIKFPISYKNFCRIYINQITSTPDDIKQVNVYNKTLTEFYRQQGYASNISVDWVSIGK